LIGTKLGPYEITAKLGEGGMGEVWRAHDTKLRRDVAIKVLPTAFVEDRERLARFEREAQLLAQLHHPHIASIFGMEESSSTKALVMELVEGPTLDERMAQGRLALEEILQIARQIAEALEEAHEKGIIHRDLKPQNVKLTADGQVKVLDFGLAKAMDPAGGATASASQLAQSPTLTLGATVQGVILGTAAYMAPEQAAGGVADRRSDVWAFGVVLYEMLTGTRLFEGETVSHVLAGVLKEEPDFSLLPDSVPPRIRRLVHRCLRKRPKHRLQAIGDARIVIDEVLAGATDEVPRAGDAAAPVTSPRPRWQFGLALAAAVAVGAVAATLLAGLRSAPPRAIKTLSEIPLPAGQSFPPWGADAALSPDGGRVAVVLVDEASGARRIWIRNLATGDARALPGTENARFPFWSPDGRSLGFRNSSQDLLMRVDLEGGRPVPLAKAQQSCGGSWGREQIVFCSHWREPLRRVAPTGGDATPVIELAAGEEAWMPIFLPDGERFLFGHSGRDLADTLFVGSVAGGATRSLLPSDSQATVVDGHIFYKRGETLLARPFDADAAELAQGEPSILAEGISDFTVAPGLLLLTRQGGVNGSRIAIYDRGGQAIDAIDSETFLDDLVLSPDGKSAAVMKVGAAGKTGNRTVDVWTIDLPRKVFNRATYGENDDDPVFSPDGQSIAFAHEGDLYRRPANGSGEPKLLVDTDADIVTQDWTADGWIVYSDVGGEGEDLFAVRAEGGEPRQLTSTPYRETLAKVSPDGRWLAYTSDESGESQVYLSTWPAFSGKWRVSTATAGMPRWGRGGRELYFLADDSKIMRATISAAANAPEIGLAEALFPTQYLGNVTSRTARWAAAADGERFFVLEAIPGEVRERGALTLITNPLAGLDRRR